MLTHAASILRPYLQPNSRQDNPDTSTIAIIGLVGVAGYVLYRWTRDNEKALAKGDWIYWAQRDDSASAYFPWSGWTIRPSSEVGDIRNPTPARMRLVYRDTREEAEADTRDMIINTYGGNPILSSGPPLAR